MTALVVVLAEVPGLKRRPDHLTNNRDKKLTRTYVNVNATSGIHRQS